MDEINFQNLSTLLLLNSAGVNSTPFDTDRLLSANNNLLEQFSLRVGRGILRSQKETITISINDVVGETRTLPNITVTRTDQNTWLVNSLVGKSLNAFVASTVDSSGNRGMVLPPFNYSITQNGNCELTPQDSLTTTPNWTFEITFI